MGVFRTIMVLTGITVVMLAPEEETATLPAGDTVSVLSAATRTVADVATFCGRQPGVCETAGYVAAKLEGKAKFGARLIYEWANDTNGDPDFAPPKDPTIAGRTVAPAQARGSTLTINDLLPRWREPKQG